MKAFLLVIMSFLIFSCGNSSKQAEQNKRIEELVQTSNAKIHYLEQGAGDTTLLFVHGWGINSSYWNDQLNFFAGNYRVIAMDLPGFGKSSSPERQQWTIENYANDVNEIITKLKLKNVILIGHSMSGDIILEASLKRNAAIIGLIGIDNFNELGEEMSADEMKKLSDFFAGMQKDFKNISGQVADEKLFQPSTDSVVRKRVKDDFAACNPMIAVSSAMQNVLYGEDEKDKLQEMDYKLYLLNSDANPTDTAGLMKYCRKGADVTYIHATGHYPMIEKTKEFNQLLANVIERLRNKE